MPRRCVFGCSPSKGLHVFPNPKKFSEQFEAWVRVVGRQDVSDLDYRKLRVCDRHFTERDWNRNNRLNALAVPSLFLPGVPLHCFPNPEKDEVRFQKWVKAIGADVASLNRNTIYKTLRICRRHFQDVYIYPKNRLSKLAIPSLHLASKDLSGKIKVN